MIYMINDIPTEKNHFRTLEVIIERSGPWVAKTGENKLGKAEENSDKASCSFVSFVKQ
jgi:hypothetical protein